MTEDGSHTLYVADMDESYHSTHGAVSESSHIFITDGLKAYITSRSIAMPSRKSPIIRVLEIGFGTGLNAYLTLLEAERLKTHIHYTTIELSPLPMIEAFKLNYPEILFADRGMFEKIHLLPWDENLVVSTYFTLNKLNVDFVGYELKVLYDVIYFDAFSPEKQPEIWTENCFRNLYKHSRANAILTTYCAKGAVRRAMQAAGFVVERLPGPRGKREILRGSKSQKL